MATTSAASPSPVRRSRLLHRNLREDPAFAVGGHGVWLVDADGREVLDGSGGAAVSCLGHQHPRVLDALTSQAKTLAYAHTSFFTTEVAEALADELVGHEPGGLASAYLVCGGSEAVETALKIARQYFLEIGEPRRTRIIARRQSYHGNTLGALAAGRHDGRRQPFAPLLADAFSHVSPAYAYREQRPDESERDFVRRLADELEAEFQRLGPDTVAAFIAEPVVGGTSGSVPAPEGYFPAMRAVCDRHGALLILDEVMCGMGRTGTLHAWEQEGVTPDVQAIAKGLGGGYAPIGATLVSGRVAQAMREGSGILRHGHTYMAHPLGCAAALAVQHVIREENLLARVRSLGALLEKQLVERFGNHHHVGDVRGRGLFYGIEIVADRASKAPFAPDLKMHARIKRAALARGLACYPGGGTIDGFKGDHVLLAPPYICTPRDIEMIVERLGEAVDAAVNEAAH